MKKIMAVVLYGSFVTYRQVVEVVEKMQKKDTKEKL